MKAITRLYVMANGKVGPAGSGRAVERYCRVGAEIPEGEIGKHPELAAYVDDHPRKKARIQPRPVETKPRLSEPRAEQVTDDDHTD